MVKKRLTKILAKANRDTIVALSAAAQQNHTPVIIKEPGKTLAMIQMRDPVKQGRFYIGEVIVSEAAVELDGTKGTAVTMGDDTEKALHMAVIDAAINKGIFSDMDTLLALEAEQEDRVRRENAMHLKTMVNFTSMDQEAPSDVNAFKKT